MMGHPGNLLRIAAAGAEVLLAIRGSLKSCSNGCLPEKTRNDLAKSRKGNQSERTFTI